MSTALNHALPTLVHMSDDFNGLLISSFANPRAEFKGGEANWAVAQGPPQLRGLHKNSKKLSPKET